ncbi:hypothetical protein [Methyloglobulus sp.]|uniref:hypothetical protein n=1 Tax=Methyloglobulus sp. TaxID=2518622 RepID=UPI003989AB1A
MNNFDGQIFFALIVALVLAWATSLLVARRYTTKVLEFMQIGTAPIDQASESYSTRRVKVGDVLQETESVDLTQQNYYARWRLRIGVVLIATVLAVIIAYVQQDAYVEDTFSWRRLCMLTLVNAWPLVPSIGLLERWSRWKILLVSVSYLLLTSVMVMLKSTDNQNLGSVLLWLFGEQIPLLVFVFFLTGSKSRAIGPYLLVVFFLLTASSLLGLSALEQVIKGGPDSWLMDLLLATPFNAYVVFILFSMVPWLPAFYPVRYMARRLAEAYRHKVFSEPLYLLSGLWSIALIFQAMTLSHSAGLSAYGILAAWLVIPLSVVLMKPMLHPPYQPPTLLLLRVFRADDGIETLFDSVVERWRYTGNTLMIAGKDLALRNLDPDELFAFLSGHLQDRFISDDARLQQAVQKLDLQADPDGRYRINEFFCFDSTWKLVLATLVDKADSVLMDLRAYTPKREGCTHELTVLATKPHLQKLVILFNKDTDKQAAEQLL